MGQLDKEVKRMKERMAITKNKFNYGLNYTKNKPDSRLNRIQFDIKLSLVQLNPDFCPKICHFINKKTCYKFKSDT